MLCTSHRSRSIECRDGKFLQQSRFSGHKTPLHFVPPNLMFPLHNIGHLTDVRRAKIEDLLNYLCYNFNVTSETQTDRQHICRCYCIARVKNNVLLQYVNKNQCTMTACLVHSTASQRRTFFRSCLRCVAVPNGALRHVTLRCVALPVAGNRALSYSAVTLFSKNSKLFEHDT